MIKSSSVQPTNFAPQKQDFKYQYRLKVVMIGDAGAGKSCMISSYVNNNFIYQTSATVGIDLKIKKVQIDKKLVQLEIWDTAGNTDHYRMIPKTYYKGADAIVIVYDITNPQSFYSMQNHWLEEVLDNADVGVKIMILGNKTDLESLRQVRLIEAQSFAKLECFIFKEVTSTEPEQIHDAFVSLLEELLINRNSIDEDRILLRKNLAKGKSCCQ